MMTQDYQFEVVLAGRDFHADPIRPSDVARLIEQVETMVRATVARDSPVLEIGEDKLIIGLSSITQSDLKCVFVTPYNQEVRHAVRLATQAIAGENFSALPQESVKALRDIQALNRDTRTISRFAERNGTYTPLAELGPDTAIQTDTNVIKSISTLYGTLMRIGGDNPPRAVLRLLDGRSFSCRVKSTALAREMAALLYSVIGVRGTATWYVEAMTLHEYRIEELLPYRETPLTEAFASLRDLVGPYYDGIEDVETFITNLRDNEE